MGKSTLFNALTASKNAEAANFPFCTIDPNIGIVDVVDERLDKLTELSKSKKKIYTNITFVDIAGLVKGASKGEGLGNKFLSHIREVDAIIHLVRCFDSEKITHVNSKINPVEDLETIKTEIILSDIDIIQKKLEKGKKKLLEEKQIKILEEKLNQLNEGKEIFINGSDEKKFLSSLGLLSIKPKIIVCNVDEESLANGNAFTKEVQNKYSNEKVVTICADIEDQIMGLDNSERETFMKEIGLNKTGLNQLIKEGYELLNLDTFFTSGPEESRAWTVEKNTPAPKAASVIHTDFEKKFLTTLGLLSIKPKIIVCNVDEESLATGNAFTEDVKRKYTAEKIVTICADIEDQIMGLDNNERETFMKEIGLNKTGLNQLIKEGYDLLNLDTFFTSGPEESRAWTIEKNTLAPQAASVIHTDFEKNFIRAEAVTCEDFIKFGSAEKCKENGKLRIEGKDYIVKDGDVLYFRVNP